MPFTRSKPALHYLVQGQGPPVVFSHALGLDLRMWDATVPALAARIAAVRYDTRSHGSSEVMTSAFTLDDLVADAVRLIEELGYDAVAWVGLSLGGMIGQGLAIAHPERIIKLVLANTTSRYPADFRSAWADRARIARTDGMAALADFLMTRFFSPAFRQNRPDEVARARQHVLSVDAAGYAACCEAIAPLDYFDRLAGIRCPTLVIAGGADEAAPVPWARDMAERIPHAELAIIPDAGHLSAVEHPDAFLKLLDRFL